MGESRKAFSNFAEIGVYPLVNLQKTMDNHHFSWVNQEKPSQILLKLGYTLW